MVCKSTVPLLLGLCRALGRFNCSEEHLITHLYPPKRGRFAATASLSGGRTAAAEVQNKSFSNFRSIIPRSLSMSFAQSKDLLDVGSQESIVDLRYVPE